MTLGAIGQKHALTSGHGRGVGGEFGNRRFHVGRIQGLNARIERGRFLLVHLVAGIPEDALVKRQAAVERQVDHCKNQCQDEQPHPPARQGVVELLQITVPDMAGRSDGIARLVAKHGLPCCTAQKKEQGNDGNNGDAADPEGPPGGIELVHDLVLSEVLDSSPLSKDSGG